MSTASHAFYVLCCLKETRHRSRLRRRHLAREEAANEHRKRNDRGGRDRRGPALAPARGVWPRVHAPPGGRLGARVRTQGPRRRDRCVFFLRRLPRANDRSPTRKTRRVNDGRVSLLGCGGVVALEGSASSRLRLLSTILTASISLFHPRTRMCDETEPPVASRISRAQPKT